ncbi:MAG: hypothetical protein WKF78_03815 [Candidatus Limnocylindrales bacterium]
MTRTCRARPLVMYAWAVAKAYTKPEQAADHVHRRGARVADRLLDEGRRRGHPVVGRERGQQDEVDLVGRRSRRCAIARMDATAAIEAVVSCAAATRRSRMPVRDTIHSSDVSTMPSRSCVGQDLRRARSFPSR